MNDVQNILNDIYHAYFNMTTWDANMEVISYLNDCNDKYLFSIGVRVVLVTTQPRTIHFKLSDGINKKMPLLGFINLYFDPILVRQRTIQGIIE